MAVDVCSSSEVLISPRISFSNDLKDTSSTDINSIYLDTTINPTRSDQLLLSPTFDFSFCTTTNLTPADELFSNGKILPTQLKKSQSTKINDPLAKPTKSPNSTIQKKPLKEFIFHEEKECDRDQEQEQEQEHEKTTSRSFWQFTRSVSLNCDNGKGPKGLLRSLSIKSLSRSNSTGSALNPKTNTGPKIVEKSKESMFLRRCASLNQPPPSSSHVYYTFRNSNTTSKTCKGGIRISPVLNIQPAFFGFGSFFCNGKVKKKTKS
uniref:uncharacterized protein LOC122585203 n=1 Tax=Erigeron canadensis TaxID=72917 RepID=UPI001CB8AF3B|nr:uncharacterized protein LOC122585203 [Erigeron canadensis]